MMNKDPIVPITLPYTPPLDDFKLLIDSIWKRRMFSNHGPVVQELEAKLREHLGVQNISLVANGTLGIQLAIRALELKGEIITSPFSYVASAAAIVWENCKPVFADIDPFTLNIDPDKIEQNITSETSAILATHIFGNASAIDRIENIAVKYNLKVIYDAAHAFGTVYKGRSIFEFGDISIASFHATKLFHTAEGGALFANDPGLNEKIKRLRNFGFDQHEITSLGINGKMSELHAALGLVNLVHIDSILSAYKQNWCRYFGLLERTGVQLLSLSDTAGFNYSYFPVIFPTEKILNAFMRQTNDMQIFPKRYFYPSLNLLPYSGNQPCPISEDVSKRVVCLPLYYDLPQEIPVVIAGVIKTVMHSAKEFSEPPVI